MKLFERIKNLILEWHVILFFIVLLLSLLFFLVLISRGIQITGSFIPMILFFIIWIIAIIFIWVIVSAILAYKTRNPRYIFQFIGLVFFTIYPLSFIFFTFYLIIYQPSSSSFPPNNYFYEVIYLSLPVGVLIMILGYFGPYHGKSLRHSRNIIVRVGSKITEMTNGFSNRPFSKYFEEIKNLDSSQFNTIAKKFAKNLARQGIILDWKLGEGKLEIIPMKQLTSDPNFFITNFIQVLKLIFKRKNLSRITIYNNGNVSAIISEKEYNEIKAPVAYHILCNNIVDIFATSFIEFSNNNYMGFNQIFIYGPSYDYKKLRGSPSPKYLKWDKEDKNSALWYVAFFVASGLTGYCLGDFMPDSPVKTNSIIPINTIMVISIIIFLIFIEHRIRRVRY